MLDANLRKEEIDQVFGVFDLVSFLTIDMETNVPLPNKSITINSATWWKTVDILKTI